MVKSSKEITKRMDVLTRDLNKLRRDMEKTVDALVAAGAGHASEGKDKLMKVGKLAKVGSIVKMGALAKAGKKVFTSGRKAIGATGGAIKSRPWLSVLGSLAIGLAVGALLDHKLRD